MKTMKKTANKKEIKKPHPALKRPGKRAQVSKPNGVMKANAPDDLKKQIAEWQSNSVTPLLAKYPERKEKFLLTSGAEVNRLYTPDDVGEVDYPKELGFPGQYPYTRGVQPTMYRGKFWTMRQYAGFGDAAESNHRYKYLLQQGQTGLSIAFDLPTQIGYDSDHPMST